MLSLQSKSCRCLYVLCSDRERLTSLAAALCSLPSGISGCHEKVEIVSGNGSTCYEDGSLASGLSQNVANLEIGWRKHAIRDLFEEGLCGGKVREPNIEREMLEVVWGLHSKWWVAVRVGLSPRVNAADF